MNFNYLKGSATLKVIIINVICFILTAAGTLYSSYLGNNYYLTISNGQIYRLVTCMFYHYGIMHILTINWRIFLKPLILRHFYDFNIKMVETPRFKAKMTI